MQNVLADELRRATRYGRPLSLALVDIDDFQRLNTVHGRLLADAVFAWIADLLRESVRSVDIVGRHGGEAFLILMPETANADAWLTAERLRLAAATGIFPAGGADPAAGLSVTISIGLATYPDCPGDTQSFLQHADDALRRAQRYGRNRIEAASPASGDGGPEQDATKQISYL